MRGSRQMTGNRQVGAFGAVTHFAGILVGLHDRLFGRIERIGTVWLTGLMARLVFASVLLTYYLNSAWGKLGKGPLGFLDLDAGAYVSIFPKTMEANGYDPSALAFFPYHVIVYFGTWSELLLPIMVVAGLFTRIAALGMIVFVIVQSYVDVSGFGLDAKSVGHPFDRLPDAIIWDQRLLWIFVLAVIAIGGAGKLSLDHLLARAWRRRS